MSDISKEDQAFVTLVVLLLSAVVAIAISGWAVCASWWSDDSQAFKVEAVKHGGAEWRTDAEGKTTFVWINHKKEQP
jgi:hypothetical protein